MNCSRFRRWSWCPQDPLGVEHLALRQYLEETLGQELGGWWINWFDCMEKEEFIGGGLHTALIQRICQQDVPELAELLFPVMREAFLTPIDQEDVRDAIRERKERKEEKSHIRSGREARVKPLSRSGMKLNALALCALLGSSACLEALLELGADPNGLDSVGGWNQTAFSDDVLAAGLPVTPLDCARAAGEEDCCFLLELYGGKTVQDLCGLEREALPQLYRQAVLGE